MNFPVISHLSYFTKRFDTFYFIPHLTPPQFNVSVVPSIICKDRNSFVAHKTHPVVVLILFVLYSCAYDFVCYINRDPVSVSDNLVLHTSHETCYASVRG